MKVKEHLLYGGSLSLALTPAFGNNTIFFFLGSILIDLDHYIDFLYYGRFKNWSIKKMFEFHGALSRWKYNPHMMALEAFHTMEFLLIFLFISFFTHSQKLSFFWFGMLFHLGLDLLRLKQWKIINVRALSFIEYWIRTKKMKKIGIHPEKIFEEAYQSIK